MNSVTYDLYNKEKLVYQGNSSRLTFIVDLEAWRPMLHGYLVRITYDHEYPIHFEQPASHVLSTSCITPQMVIEQELLTQLSDDYDIVRDNTYSYHEEETLYGRIISNIGTIEGRISLHELEPYSPNYINPLLNNHYEDWEIVTYSVDATENLVCVIN